MSTRHLANYLVGKTEHAPIACALDFDVTRCQHAAVVMHHATYRVDLDVIGGVVGERNHIVHAHRYDARRRHDALGAFVIRVELFLTRRLQQRDEFVLTGGLRIGVRRVVWPVPPEERVAEHVGAAAGGQHTQHARPCLVHAPRNYELVQVREYDVARRRHVTIQTVVECRHLCKIVHFRCLTGDRRPRVNEHRKWPLYDVDEMFVFHGAQVLSDAVSTRVVVKYELGGAEHPVHFHHLRQLAVAVVPEVERRHAHREFVRLRGARAHQLHIHNVRSLPAT